jgi:DNA-binding MarR family transcriptional regulator
VSPARDRRRPAVEESIVLTLFDLSNHLTRGGEKLAALGGITARQWLLLLHVAGDRNWPWPGGVDEPAGALASEIADLRGVSRAHISAVLASLRRKGLVRQVPDHADRRRKRLTPTAAGRRALRRIEPARRRANRHLLAGLKPAERRKLLTGLESCLRTLWGEHTGSLQGRSGHNAFPPPYVGEG